MKKQENSNSNNDVQGEDRNTKKKSKKLGNKNQSQRSGHWNQDQKIKYIIFLQFHKDKFQLKQQQPRKFSKQCRILFKLEPLTNAEVIIKKSIIEHHKNSVRPDVYEIQYQKFLKCYNKKMPTFDESECEQQVQQKKPIIMIPNNPQKNEVRGQSGFQTFVNSSTQNSSHYNILQSIFQIYMRCLNQDNKGDK